MAEPASNRLRAQLVAELRANGLSSEAVAAAFSEVPREEFIPDVLAERGIEAVYRDRAYPVKHDAYGRALSSSSQPGIMAEMLELLELAPGHRVLEVGAGTGYNAALLSCLVGAPGRVTTIDVAPDLVRRARGALRRSGYRADVRQADGREGFPPGAPYDRIVVTACADTLERAWLEQLCEGGRVIVPLRLDLDTDAVQLIPVLERRGRQLRSLEMTWGGFMPLHGGDGGYQGLPASLNANRSRRGGPSAYVSVSGAAVARLSDAAARRVLASMLEPQRPRARGWTALGRDRMPLVLVYLLSTVPTARRVWVRRSGWHGIGILDRRGGLATVTIRDLWEARTEHRQTRARWQLHCWGRAERVCEELDALLERWRDGRCELVARPAGTSMRVTLRWRER